MKQRIILISLLINHFYLSTVNLKVKKEQISLECDNQGYPKKNALKSIITAYYLHKTDDKKISIQEVPGGLYSEKLYMASVKKDGHYVPIFFFKISKKTASTNNLIKIQEGEIGQKLHTCNKRNMPHVILLENVFTYQDQNGTKRTIEVTPSAQGKLIKEILESKNSAIIKKAGYLLGKSLATFHQLYIHYDDPQDPHTWKTVCHRDFHAKNVFFDSDTEKIYFIDNETMNENTSIGQDLRPILVSMIMVRYLQANINAHWPLYMEYCQSFLKGYVESYPSNKRKVLIAFIEEVLNKGIEKLLMKMVQDKSLNGKEFDEKKFKKIIYDYLHHLY